MPVLIRLSAFGQGLRQLGKIQQAQLRRLFQLRRHLAHSGIDVLAFELFQRGHQHFQLRDLLVVRGQQGLCLDIEQVGGHLNKLAGDLQVHALHLGQIFQVLVQYLGDFNIPDLNFIFRKQHQDQAQGAFKILKLVFFLYDAFKKKAWIFHGSLT